MTSRERFLNAVMRQPVDRVPLFDFLFQRPLFTALVGRTPAAYNARDAMALTRALGLDGVWIPYGCFSGWSPEQIRKNVYRDEWGTTFEAGDASWPIDAPVDYPLKSREDLALYAPPDPRAPGRLDEIETAVRINGDTAGEPVAILGGVGGPLTLSWMLLGYERIGLMLYDDPAWLRDVAQLAVDFALPAVDRMAEAGVDGMIVSEDLGSSSGGLLSPQHFRAIYKPALAEIVRRIKKTGLPVILHSCGRIYEFLDDVADIGVDALHALQRTAGMDLAAVKRGYGHRMCLIGNIDSSRTLPFGSPDDVAREVRDAIAVAAPGSGYILGSDHSLHDGISVENILAMFRAAREAGRTA